MRQGSGADAFRRWGYLQANLDPLDRLRPQPHLELDAVPEAEAARWRAIYCSSIGVEFMHIPDPERRCWIAARMEAEAAPARTRPPADTRARSSSAGPAPAGRPADAQTGPAPPDPDRMLRRLATAELFERFVHARYVGTKRYSLEGAAALIPLLDVVLDTAACLGTEVALIGMSHRGRLTVMLHVVGVPAAHVFAGFEDFDPRKVMGGGDVKYHLGATGDYPTASGRQVHVHLVSNPSHLEAVNPIVLGRVRARQERLGVQGSKRVLCITVHGDAAFAGQGIVAETLNLSELPGSSVGGSIQIVVNNLIGFTTEPASLHSSRFASDVAKRLAVPIFHVNGEDPEAVVRVGRLAIEYRAAFASDVVVDMICYRRHGHSEVDDPTTTQPLLYRRIAARPRLWEVYAEQLGKTSNELEELRNDIESALEREQEKGRALQKIPVLRRLPSYWDAYRGGRYDPALEVETAVSAESIEEIARRITSAPKGFTVHEKVRRVLDLRLEMGLGKREIDWGMAEAPAFGTLLRDGMLVRLSGQDSRRGTFNHRHAVLVDFETGEEHVPLQHAHPQQARFDVRDSTLSEASELGFEYGFSRDYPDALVCWEAQFGDFVNGAQVILDQFLCAAEDKWDLLSGIVLLLPHGYEGQGPEHSSARLERFLQLAAKDNIQVCQPSTSAQYFHLLRRQALRSWRKPLVVLTPKGMLRAPAAGSKRDEFTAGRFRPVLDDPQCPDAKRILVCSGKIAHELRAARQRRRHTTNAILTLEQLQPFPEDEVRAAFARHGRAREVVWVQEEPANMGGLFFVRPILDRLAGERRVTSVKRSASASPATGSAKAHAIEQKALLELAFASFG
ncbi:MAG: 2-oxoglutarate dehydrogenase E1 component [Candidatus Krumholzibacteriia bacterium]